MTSSGLTFPHAGDLNNILSQKDHFLSCDTYLKKLKLGVSMKLPLPMMSMDAKGATILSINQGLFIPPNLREPATVKKSMRLTLSTIYPENTPFDPRANTDVELITDMPISDSIKVRMIPSITELMNADTEEEIHSILAAPISEKSQAKTI